MPFVIRFYSHADNVTTYKIQTPPFRRYIQSEKYKNDVQEDTLKTIS
jgi:hypothetical protein